MKTIKIEDLIYQSAVAKTLPELATVYLYFFWRLLRSDSSAVFAH